MEKKKKRAPEQKLTRATIIALVVIVLVYIGYGALILLRYFTESFIYPIARHGIGLQISIFIIVLGASLQIVIKIIAKRLHPIIIILPGIYIVFFCLIAYVAYWFQGSSEEADIIRFDDKVYYIVESTQWDFDYESASHSVYECDSWRLICQEIKYYDYGIFLPAPPAKFTLSDDESELYVIIGEEEFLVATQSPCENGRCD